MHAEDPAKLLQAHPLGGVVESQEPAEASMHGGHAGGPERPDVAGGRSVPMIWRPLCKTLNGPFFDNRNKQNLFLFHHLIASIF
jgi:hypothetical protein